VNFFIHNSNKCTEIEIINSIIHLMPSSELLEFHAPDVDIRLRVRLLAEENPNVVAAVLDQLPVRSMLGHVVISGEAIWLPTRIVHLTGSNMVKRSPGAVYLYAPGQSICLTYGSITESALVNKFGELLEDDLPKLRRLGELVWERTVTQPRRSIVNINIQRAMQ
jgi:hypothetical protein